MSRQRTRVCEASLSTNEAGRAMTPWRHHGGRILRVSGCCVMRGRRKRRCACACSRGSPAITFTMQLGRACGQLTRLRASSLWTSFSGGSNAPPPLLMKLQGRQCMHSASHMHAWRIAQTCMAQQIASTTHLHAWLSAGRPGSSHPIEHRACWHQTCRAMRRVAQRSMGWGPLGTPWTCMLASGTADASICFEVGEIV